jgi:hypothetical protein
MGLEQGNTQIQEANAKIEVNVYFAVLLEDLTVQALKLERLGLFSLLKNQDRIQNFSLLKIYTKSNAIRLSIFTAFKASFKEVSAQLDVEDPTSIVGSTPMFDISFTIPESQSNIAKVEDFLIALKSFSYNEKTISYQRGTLKVLRSKKTAPSL